MADAPETAAADAAATLAAAVSGPLTPAAAGVVSRPSPVALWALALGGPAICVMIAAICWLLTLAPWPFHGPAIWPDGAGEWRAKMVGAIGVTLALILAVITFRLASGGLKRIEAHAGPGSITVEGEG